MNVNHILSVQQWWAEALIYIVSLFQYFVAPTGAQQGAKMLFSKLKTALKAFLRVVNGPRGLKGYFKSTSKHNQRRRLFSSPLLLPILSRHPVYRD